MSLLAPIHPPVEGLKHQQNNVLLHVERENLGKGSLFIAESCVAWINATGQGLKVPYPAISLHAVSRDLTAFPHECLYLMIDAAVMPEILQIPSFRDSGGAGDNNEDGTEEDVDGAIREFRFIPDDKQALEQMFSAMSSCQTLHPDPDDSEPSDEDYGDEFEDAEEGSDLEEGAEGVEGSRVSEVAGQDTQGQASASLNGHVGSGVIKTASQLADSGAQEEAMDTGQFADADAEMEPDH
ncbi:methylosome subunit pICln-like [Acanthaster planci]|uniref:Methylosome subunit pICln n=1 Tax=Acanthaster planci TaxID=133434 RepID=A0A8B7Y4Q6_ACAPL|nr:methylosome subunit pICln-like [Acanthaster planci]